jgi:flavin-dependent dehydrogenase
MSSEPLDLLVVGGGPAGLAAALAARRAGLERVKVIDQRRPPIDKACGEGLMPDALARLAELGVDLDGAGFPFRGIRYVDGAVVADGTFPGGAHGLGLRRPFLHQALIAAAEAAGVQLAWGVKVHQLERCGAATAWGTIPARWVAAADGLHSKLRRQAGLTGRPAPRRRFGLRRHFRIAPWCDRVEVHWGRGAEAYVTPVAADEIGVALLWSREPEPGGNGRFESLLRERFPALAERLAGAEVTSSDRGSGPLEQRVRRVTTGCLALVGDASGYVDAITGEGLALAFHQAVALSEALAAGDLAPYRAAHRRIARLPDAVTRLMLWLERHPRLRHRLMRALAADPELFSRFLGVHARSLTLGEIGLGGALRLARDLATA